MLGQLLGGGKESARIFTGKVKVTSTLSLED